MDIHLIILAVIALVILVIVIVIAAFVGVKKSKLKNNSVPWLCSCGKVNTTDFCESCNSKKPKRELIRIVKDKENNIFIDRTGKLEGRGAYICDDINCLEKVIKSKRLESQTKS